MKRLLPLLIVAMLCGCDNPYEGKIIRTEKCENGQRLYWVLTRAYGDQSYFYDSCGKYHVGDFIYKPQNPKP